MKITHLKIILLISIIFPLYCNLNIIRKLNSENYITINIKNDGNTEVYLFNKEYKPLQKVIIINGITQDIFSNKYILPNEENTVQLK